MSSDSPIRFYFDYISSNAYLAWPEANRLAEQYGRVLEPEPVLFAGFLEAFGQLGPAEIPVKSWWMIKNNLRKAALLGLPLNPPAHHPWNPLLPLRISSLPLPRQQRHAVIDGFFSAFWSRGLHASEPEVAAEVVAEAGLDAASILAEAQSEASKLRLRRQTDAAIERGVFGVPSMLVDDEVFWGYDDLPYLERLLAGKDPLDAERLGEWLKTTPSASRPRAQRGERGS